jgi:hypothetical protein
MKIILIIALALMVSSCAPLVIGGVTGVVVHRYDKCVKWIHTPYGDRKVWLCKHFLNVRPK